MKARDTLEIVSGGDIKMKRFIVVRAREKDIGESFLPCSRSRALGPSEKPIIRVAGEVKDVARLAAGALGRALSVLEVPALLVVRDAPNLHKVGI